MYPAIHLTSKQANRVYCWGSRKAAIEAEIEFLNKFFGGISGASYNTVATEFKDEECLVQALNDVGYADVEVHETYQSIRIS